MSRLIVLFLAAPLLVAGPLESWTSASGKSLEAEFVGVKGNTVVLKDADGRERIIPLARLSPADQKKARARGQKGGGTGAIATREGQLPAFTASGLKGVNTLYTTQHYRAMLQAGGALLVQVLEDGKVVGPGIVFRIHRTHTNERMPPESRTQHKEIASIEQAPKPQRLTKPSELTVEGTFTDEATFTLTIALDEKGVTFKVAYDEPSRLPLPASLVPCIYILPSVDFQNKEQQEIDAETEGWEMKLSGPKLRGTYSFSQAMTGVPNVTDAVLHGPWGARKVEIELEPVKSRPDKRYGAFQIYNGKQLCESGRLAVVLSEDREKSTITLRIK
jgi:hypothetical protein